MTVKFNFKNREIKKN